MASTKNDERFTPATARRRRLRLQTRMGAGIVVPNDRWVKRPQGRFAPWALGFALAACEGGDLRAIAVGSGAAVSEDANLPSHDAEVADAVVDQRGEAAPEAAAPADECTPAPTDVPAARPPIGWWGRRLECSPEYNETKFVAILDALQASGMREAGYRFVQFDSCWPARAPGAPLSASLTRFPSGMPVLAQLVHDRGFSLGVGANRGSSLCGSGADSVGHEALDASTFAAWGADLLSYNECGAPAADRRAQSEAMASALKAQAPSTVFALGSTAFEEWMPSVGQIWRTAPAALPTWASIITSLDANAWLAPYVHVRGFADPGALEVGNGNLTESEARAQFTLWAMMSAPLTADTDVTNLSETTRAMLTNQELIAVDQDGLGLQAARIRDDGANAVQVFAKPLASCGTRAVTVLNRGVTPAVGVNVDWEDVWLQRGVAKAQDLWDRQVSLASSDAHLLTVTVPPHDVRAFKIVGIEPPAVRGDAYLSDAPFTYAANFYGPVERDLSNGEQLRDGVPIKLRGKGYAKGLGAHGPSLIRFRLGPGCTRFTADVGVDDEVALRGGSVVFAVWADGKLLAESGVLTGSSPAYAMDVALSGARDLRLFVGNGGDGTALDHADWADARVQCPP